jgi:hypothetical protein
MDLRWYGELDVGQHVLCGPSQAEVVQVRVGMPKSQHQPGPREVASNALRLLPQGRTPTGTGGDGCLSGGRNSPGQALARWFTLEQCRSPSI